MEEKTGTKKIHWNWVIALLCIVIVAGAYFFIIRPYGSKIESLADERVNLTKELRLKEEEMEFWKTVASYQEVDERYVELMRNSLPLFPNTIDLVVNMESLAQSAGMDMEEISFGNEMEEYEKDINTDAYRNVEVRDIGVKVSLSGMTYTRLKDFVRKVEGNLRLMEIRQFQFIPSSQSLSVDMKAYYISFGNKKDK